MTKHFLTGELVELVSIDLEKDTDLMEKWNQDSDYLRQLDMDPANQYSSLLLKEWIEKEEDDSPFFMIRTLAEQKKIGFVGLGGFNWAAQLAWVGIGIGDPEYRGKGYGTEAMKLILKYAFRGLNLHRVSLDVFDYNTRAIRSYEKCGFVHEGTQRQMIFKEDQRWNVLNMGILDSEWYALQG